MSDLQHFDISSRDPQDAHRVIRDVTGAEVVAPRQPAEGFRFSYTGAACPDLAIGRLQYSVEATLAVDTPQDSIMVFTRLGGRLHIDAPGYEARPPIRHPTLAPIAGTWRADLANVTMDVVRISRQAADDASRSFYGVDADDLRFSSPAPLSAATARHWTNAVTHTRRHVLDDDEVAASPSMVSVAARWLAAVALVTFPHPALLRGTEAPYDEPPTTSTTPASVRRAMTFIDDRAADDIGIDDIAAAARISRRALQNAFRRYLDCTPLEHLRRVRLARAHAALQEASPARGVTVAAIAARWGFGHPGRFSTDYRAAYGRLPSETLES